MDQISRIFGCSDTEQGCCFCWCCFGYLNIKVIPVHCCFGLTYIFVAHKHTSLDALVFIQGANSWFVVAVSSCWTGGHYEEVTVSLLSPYKELKTQSPLGQGRQRKLEGAKSQQQCKAAGGDAEQAIADRITVDPRLKGTSLKGFSIQPAARPCRCQNPGPLLSTCWAEVWGGPGAVAQQTQGFALPLLAALLPVPALHPRRNAEISGTILNKQGSNKISMAPFQGA